MQSSICKPGDLHFDELSASIAVSPSQKVVALHIRGRHVLVKSIVDALEGLAGHTSAEADAVITITEQPDGYCSLRRIMHGTEQSISCHPDAVLSWVVSWITAPDLLRTPGWALFHGGTIAIDERRFVFLGSSRAGKSSLLIYLLANYPVAQYLSDEVVAINAADLSQAQLRIPIATRMNIYDIIGDNNSWIAHY